MEIWRDIEGFEGKYQISNLGRVKSLRFNKSTRSKILKNAINNYGYHTVTLYNDSSRYVKQIHRLVAETFIKNEDIKPHVNHIDGNKSNNNVNNLEWCSVKENVDHAYEHNLISNHRNTPIKIRCNELNIDFDSFSDASRFFQCSRAQIRNIIIGKYKRLYKKYTFSLL